MTLDASGRLGIGTAAPAYLLDVVKNQNASTIASISNSTSGSSAYAAYRIGSTANVWLYNFSDDYATSGRFAAGTFLIDSANTNGININASASNILFSTANTERMRIASSGNVLIGTTTDAGYKLDVNGTARVQGDLTISGTGSGITFDNPTGQSDGLTFKSSGTNVWSINKGAGDGSENYNFYNFGRNSTDFSLNNSTGVATFAGRVNIGNPVAAAVAVASTHKVEISIGGVTYYLLATT